MNKDQLFMQSPRTYKPWQRITSLFTLVFFLFQIPTIAFAQALQDGVIQAHFNSEPQFEPSSGGNNLFQPASYLTEIQEIFYSIDDFKNRLVNEHKSTLGESTFVPIAVGDITTFIPVHRSIQYKNVGTPFVQSRYVRAQIIELLGRTLIDPDDTANFGTESQQLISLYNNAFDYARLNTNILFGQKLNLDREAAPIDMIWPELRVINGQKVFVPIVYLSVSTVDDRRVDSHITEFDGDLTGFLNITVENAEIKLGRDSFIEVVKELTLNNGTITSEGDLKIATGGTLRVLSSQIDANGNLKIAAHGVEARTLVHRYDLGRTKGTKYDVITNISSDGDMIIRSFRDISIQGSNVYAGGSMTLAADGSIYVGGVQYETHERTKHGRWKGTKDTVDYLPSSLTAEENIELIANSEIVIDAADLISKEGHLNLLAGMGITIENEFSSTRIHEKYKKKKKEVSAYETVAIRAALDAGKGVTIHSEYGDINLRATDIKSAEGTVVTANNGAINLLIAKETDHYSYHAVSKRTFSTRTVNRGHNIETAVYPTIIGGFKADALYGLNVDFALDKSLSKNEQLDQLAEMEGMSWIKDIRDSDQVTWQEIELAYETWNHDDTNLNAAAMALITIAVVVATGPLGAGLTGASGAIATSVGGGALGMAASAGFTAIVTQASLSLANGNTVGETLEQLAQEESLKSVAISMVSAAALASLDAAFFDEIPVEEVDSSILFDAKDQLSLIGQATQAATKAAVQAGINVATNGGDLGDFSGLFAQNLMQHGINVLGQHMAQKIGLAFEHGLEDPGAIDTALKYVAHAGAGCVIGAATATNLGNQESSDGCLSGGVGAAVGEFVGSVHKELTADEVKEAEDAIVNFYEKEEAYVLELKEQGLTNKEIAAAMQNKYTQLKYYTQELDNLKQAGVDLARLGAAFGAFAAGADAAGINLAADTGANAAENNLWFIAIPFIIKAIDIALLGKEIYDEYSAIDEAYRTGGDDAGDAALADFIHRYAQDKAYEKFIGLLLPGAGAGIALLKKSEILAKVRELGNKSADIFMSALEKSKALGSDVVEYVKEKVFQKQNPPTFDFNYNNIDLHKSQLMAEEIAHGHAFEKHVVERAEFVGLGIRTRDQYKTFVEDLINNPVHERRYDRDGKIYILDETTRTIVIKGPKGEGTAFRPDFGVGWEEYKANFIPSNTNSPAYDPVNNGRIF